MAPATERRPRGRRGIKNITNYFTLSDIKIILQNPTYNWLIALGLLVFELFLTLYIIYKVPYTEIDWKAYMQEVEGVLNGTLDYLELKGDTGPLVYPAGFVYVYSILYAITQKGENIFLAQHIFAFLYLATLYYVFKLYTRSQYVPPYALIFMCCTSYRVHAIFVLRLFNDPVAIFLLFVSLNYLFDQQWFKGCILYSLAVSVKMNILLFAPGLLFVLLHSVGLKDTCKYIMICGFTQVLLGLPFLATHPFSYISRSFDFGRVFLHVWTVNWRFIPEHIFVSPYFHLPLLLCHLIVLVVFAIKWTKNFGTGALHSDQEDSLQIDNFMFVMFTSNFVGIVFARSLHYQFYVWYFFTLPYLLWSTNYPVVFKLCILGILELCWNTYPSTALSSGFLHLCHFLILFHLLYFGKPHPRLKPIKSAD